MSLHKWRFVSLAVWLCMILTLPAGCAAPAASPPLPTGGPAASPTPQPSSTPDPELSAMILNLSGSITNVHDPTMIQANGVYYLVSTGPGIPIRCSNDMQAWAICGRVLDANPEWVITAIVGVKDLWAPDIVFHNGTYYLFYAASTFGSNRSAIGLATNATLDPNDPQYAWADQGEVFSSQKTDPYNALDPNLVFDQSGQPWLVFGSFWSGIKMVRVDPVTFKAAGNAELFSLAAKPGSDAIEGAFITWRDGFYYLFVSHDFCCRGVNSTYNIRVGRSKEITGPYLDQDDRPMTQGGGSVIYRGSERWHGPGHNSIYIEGDTYYLVYHAYDNRAAGVPTLRVEALKWDSAGWPHSPSQEIEENK